LNSTFDRKNSKENVIPYYSTKYSNTYVSNNNISPKYFSDENSKQKTINDKSTIKSISNLETKPTNKTFKSIDYNIYIPKSKSKKKLSLIKEALYTSTNENKTYLENNTSRCKNTSPSLRKKSSIRKSIDCLTSMLSRGKLGFLDKSKACNQYNLSYNNFLNISKSQSKDKKDINQVKRLNCAKLESESFITKNSEAHTKYSKNDISISSNSFVNLSEDITLHSILNGYKVEENIGKQINCLRKKNRKNQLEIKLDYCTKQISYHTNSSKLNCINKPMINANSPKLRYSHKDYLNFSPTRKPKESFVQCNLLRKVIKNKENIFNEKFEKVLNTDK
jgi:hypothetical protein